MKQKKKIEVKRTTTRYNW